ncbi:hypothetical protein K2173_006946 [Erythroxylum novogranatense]|uniref:NmrA-like domain-containing protein n=1 Tax=Erythroxylum novogranatense TaxID=1862640 RepID=A0AAV8S6X3_9ROSI|nr:hypothetical protein K2173_006946 [Erythroxylum novogranatense]
MGFDDKSKILIFGATGYLGKYLVKASTSMGHPTYAYVRPSSHPSKLETLKEFDSMGVTVIQGELDEHEKLVSALRLVKVVISALAVPQYPDQLEIITAIKEAGNIERFVPSEYGNEADRVNGLPPFEAVLANKRKIRRAIEAAGIPFTYVSANSFTAYFVNFLLHTHNNRDEIIVYGSGQAKAVLNYEGDIATYTIRAATDPRLANRLIIYRPQGNVVSQLDLISLWETRTGRSFRKIHVPEEEIVRQSNTLPFPENVPLAILHNIFIKGDQTSFELTSDDVEASMFYPDHKYTAVDSFLDTCLIQAGPIPKLASFG